MNISLPSSCEGCVLAANPACGKFTAVEGLGGLGVLVVAEASGEHEGAAGLPLRPHAPSGGVFEKALRLAGYRRDQFAVTNVLRCRPPGNFLEGAPYEREAIDTCRNNLDEAVERFKPRVILTLGGIPTRELTGLSGGKLSHRYLRGYVLPSRYGIPVVPSFHPAYILRGKSALLGRLMSDISTAVGVAQGWHPGPVEDPRELMEARSGYEALLDLYQRALADPGLLVGYDIETFGSEEEDEDGLFEFSRDVQESGDADSEEEWDGGHRDETADESGGPNSGASLDIQRAKIRTVQFAISDRWGVSVPYDEGYRELIMGVLGLPNPKVSHNGTWFDNPVLERHGFVIRGRLDDTLPMYGALQPDLPKHLQAVAQAYGWRFPWKHFASTDHEFYGVTDVCVLHLIMTRLPGELRRLGIWDNYENLFRRRREIVLRPMELRGLPVDVGRVTELRGTLTAKVAELDEGITKLAPAELNTYETYDNMPPMAKEYVLSRHPEWFAPVLKTYKNGKTKEIKSKNNLKGLYRELLTSSEQTFRDTLADVLEMWPQLRVQGERLAWFEPFNPASTQQMQSYLRLKKYPLPTNFKTGKVTTSEKELARLAEKTKDPLIPLVRERRVVDKMVGSYTGRLQPDGTIKGGWVPGPDGRLRPTITFKSTGQLASSNPNVMTLPVRREELAESFRRCIVAEPGHLILELDMHAFHAQTTGLAAQDLDYMRLSRLDIHSYVTGWLVKDPRMKDALGWSDGDLGALLTEIKAQHKRIRNLQAKPAILGIGFGMGYKRLYFENRDYFVSEAEAKKLLDLIKALFPKVFEWQERTVAQAGVQGYLQNSFGRRRWFWDATKWEPRRGVVPRWKYGRQSPKWEEMPSRDAEKAKAFLPASNAHDMLGMKVLEMAERGWLERYELVNIVHDAVVFHPRVELLEEAAGNVKGLLESPVLELADPIVCPAGFTCEAEVSAGPDWGKRSMKEVRV